MRPDVAPSTKREPDARDVSDWTYRDAEPEDEDCLASMWLGSYASSSEAQDAFAGAEVSGSAEQIRYWRVHQPIVTALLRSARVVVACDPQRASYEPGRPAIIVAWACMDDEAVHWVAVKRNASKAGFGEELVRGLLGERLERDQRTTFELVDMAKLRLIPKHWKRDRGWLSSLRSMSQRVGKRDAAYVAAASHVLDARRDEWKTGKERAA